jgi:hypothetical protein
MFGLVADGLGVRFGPRADKAINLLFDNANNGYNEVRIIQCSRYFAADHGPDPGTCVCLPSYHH